jgi:hypothetical protein
MRLAAVSQIISGALRRFSRRQVIALVTFIIWASLLGLGLLGGNAHVLPPALTTAAGVVALIPLVFLIPAWALYGLLRGHDAIRPNSLLLANQWRWRFAISGGLITLMACVLLVPSTPATLEIRIVGVVALAYGILCIWVAVLGFRAKARLAALNAGNSQ